QRWHTRGHSFQEQLVEVTDLRERHTVVVAGHVLDPWLMILPWHLGCHYLPSPPPMPDFLVTLSQLILTCWVLKVALVNTLTGWVAYSPHRVIWPPDSLSTTTSIAETQ